MKSFVQKNQNSHLKTRNSLTRGCGIQPPLEFFQKTPLTRRCENAKKRRFEGSCFAAWNIISAKTFFAESLWFIDDQGPHFEGMIGLTINAWLFSKNCVAYLRFFEIFACNFFAENISFDSICSILQFPPRRVLLSRTSEIQKLLHCLDEMMQKARKNLADWCNLQKQRGVLQMIILRISKRSNILHFV